MGLEGWARHTTETLITRRPFNGHEAESQCQLVSCYVRLCGGRVPQGKIMGLTRALFACLGETALTLKRRCGRSVSVECPLVGYAWKRGESHYFLL